MQSAHESKFPACFFSFWCDISAFMHLYFSFIIKNGCALGMCLVFKTVVSSYRSYDTFKIFKMERGSFKEYSEAAIVEKEEL